VPAGRQGWLTRPGEGTPVTVRVKYDVGMGGQSVAHMEVDASDAPVPDRRYVADMYTVVVEDETFWLAFGQRRLKSKELRSLLVIQLSRAAVEQILTNVDQVKNPTFLEIIKQIGRTPIASTALDHEPGQTVELSANFTLCGMSGDEAIIDFYKASAFSIRAAPQQGKLSLDPVVRVELRSDIAVGAFEELRRIVGGLPAPAAGAGL
jgi:hypothetical protein